MENVPVHTTNPAHASRPGGKAPRDSKGYKQKNKLAIASLVGGVILIAIVAIFGWLLYSASVTSQIEDGKFQAVFFTNGQVYFGKLQKLNGDYFKLTDIFYLQAPTDSTSTDSKNPQATSSQSASNVQLVKLGSEVHGPEDSMIMNKDQILFFENLKPDGKVATSITKYNSQKK